MQSIFNNSLRTIALMLIVSFFLFTNESLSQNGLKIFEVPGGGSGSTQTEDSNDNTTIYVVGGLIIAGILAYALFFKEKKKETDTTASINSNLNIAESEVFNSPEHEVQKAKDNIPFDIFWGIKRDEALLNERTYQLGLRIKL